MSFKKFCYFLTIHAIKYFGMPFENKCSCSLKEMTYYFEYSANTKKCSRVLKNNHALPKRCAYIFKKMFGLSKKHSPLLIKCYCYFEQLSLN